MPWKTEIPMEQRMSMIEMWKSGRYTNAELFERYGVSAKTGYKWISRYREGGFEGLRDLSRAPLSCPHRASDEVVEALCDVRRKHPRWGPKKIVAYLARHQQETRWPAVSTAGEILKRAGLVTSRRRRRRSRWPARAMTKADFANHVWPIDFKGQFRIGSGALCYPLTLSDLYSRYQVCCDAKVSTAMVGVRSSMERVFREHGLPWVIRSDNGEPFASHGLCGLNRLNVWWMRLGIRHETIDPGHPEQNGVHERMHRELKAETARPPAPTLAGQQGRFDAFRAEWNHERPHEALGQQLPATLWQPSPRPFPEQLLEPQYPGHLEIRRVRSGGVIKFKGRMPFISQALSGEAIGLEEIEDGVWSIRFVEFEVGRLDERTWRIC